MPTVAAAASQQLRHARRQLRQQQARLGRQRTRRPVRYLLRALGLHGSTAFAVVCERLHLLIIVYVLQPLSVLRVGHAQLCAQLCEQQIGVLRACWRGGASGGGSKGWQQERCGSSWWWHEGRLGATST